MKLLAVALGLVCTCLQAAAQKNGQAKGKPKITAPKTEKPEKSPADLLYENMLESTQVVFFVDSIVVEKDQFLNYIPLPSECGQLTTYEKFFGKKGTSDGYAYINEYGNKAFYSTGNGDATSSRLMTTDKLGNAWTTGQPLNGIDQTLPANYPFLMADGTTLYFSQKGENSVGGYDIFVTRYDPETGEYLRPQNIGLPFNSKANDYLYVEDELDSVGWFVTDRNQPEGKVCIYTFEPKKTRKNYDLSETGTNIRNYADIRSIKDTWPSDKARQVVMDRVERMKQRSSGKETTATVSFIINDDRTYTSEKDFRSDEARHLFGDWKQATERANADTRQLEALRERYAISTTEERKDLQPTILEAEQELLQLQDTIRIVEKSIRNIENRALFN